MGRGIGLRPIPSKNHKMNKRLPFLALLLGYLPTLPAWAAESYFPQTLQEFNAIRFELKPGDTVVLPEGEISWRQIYIGVDGTAEEPITLKAPYIYGTTLTGVGYVQIAGDHVVVQGIRFINNTGTFPLIIEGGNHNRITQCYFSNASASSYLRIDPIRDDPTTAANNTIEHNYFTATAVGGITIVGTAEESHVGRNVIEHNVFRDAPSRSGGGESIILFSNGKHQDFKLNTQVRYNVFDNWDSDIDDEIITIKSGDNFFYRNVFAWCNGYFSFRRENGTWVEGNVLYENSEGFRIYGEDHVIINNLVYNTGFNALYFLRGWTRQSDGIIARAGRNVTVANNTFVEMGFQGFNITGTSIQPDGPIPVDNLVANNIFYSPTGQSRMVNDAAGFFSNNEVRNNLFKNASGNIGPQGQDAILADPLLTGNPLDGFFLSAQSPAIGTGIPVPQVTKDFFGRTRSPGAMDLGYASAEGDPPTLAELDLPPIPPDRSNFANLPLEARFTLYPSTVRVNEPANLDASISTGPIKTYRWDLGDGHVYEDGIGFYPYHWDTAGEKNITLTVILEDGTESTLTQTVLVETDGELPLDWQDTGSWLGWIEASQAPWLFVLDWGRYVYGEAVSGDWVYVPRK